MSQHDFEIANQGFPAFRSDLNSGLQALASNSAGATEPSTTFAYQFWYDETTDLLKLRNSDDDAWITLAAFDQTNDEWEIRSAVIQAVDSAGVVIKTDDGTTRIEVQDDGDVSIDSGTLFVDASTNRVGVGTTSPDRQIEVSGSSPILRLTDTDTVGSSSVASSIEFFASDGQKAVIGYPGNNDFLFSVIDNYNLRFSTNNTERMRIDSSGNLFVACTSNPVSSSSIEGLYYEAGDYLAVANSEGVCAYFNRQTSDGTIAQFRKDGLAVGSIGTAGNDLAIGTGDTGLGFSDGLDAIRPTNMSTLSNLDNAIDLGTSSARFDDIYATNGTIQTSDRNEKQDIEELTEAEQRVAVAAKALLRKFRWKDAVAKKGDDARIHFGIIAQDLQAAFEAEGLDAGRYAMFIHTEWWETYTDVPAVETVDAVYETVTDEEGNETQVLVSEAVEAKEAYTRTDTYDTEDEAPEGAVKKSRMGVRYSELLAFIIAAI